MREALTRSEAETEALAAELAAAFQGGEVVLLSGELGSGKTVFVRGLARGVGADPAGGPEEQGYPAGIEPGEGHDAEGDARRQKRAEAEVELRQRMLADTSPSRGATEIFEEHRQLSVIRLLGARELLELGEHFPDAVDDADEAIRGGQNQRAGSEDHHRRRDHRREDADRRLKIWKREHQPWARALPGVPT